MAIRLLNLLGRRRLGRLEPEPGGYLTDGQDLFRVLGSLGHGRGSSLICLEDCRTLRWRLLTPRELREMGMHSVGAPAGLDAAVAG